MTEKDYGSRYRVTEKIGAGGMADVYKGVDNVLGRTVAVKVLHARLAADATFAARFRQEAQAAANLSSPNIVSIYDWGKTGDTYYIVMEFVDGKDLKDIIAAEGPLAPTRVADIGAQVASALEVAHRADVIHRDVKPHNIMVQPDGTVKVMDFGIARAGNTTMTQTGSVLGTAHYVSPEQAQGKQLTPASDIYSLGVSLYEAATGKMPFDADTPVAVALKQVNEQPVPPRKLSPAIPVALETVILKAMAKDPAQRYASADSMRRDLLAVSAGRPVAATVPKMDQTAVMTAVPTAPTGRGAARQAPPKKKSRWWLWTLLVLALLAGGLAAAWAMGAFEPSISVPNLRGKTVAQAADALKAEGLAIGTTRSQFDANVEAGRVLEQDPTPGTQVESGAKVNLVISRGVEKVEVPDVVGKTDSEAAQILQDAGFALTLPKREFSGKPEGTVLSQDPEGGSSQPKGSSITLTVSKGQQLIEVPNVEGKGQSNATAILEDAGFSVDISTEFSDTVSKGVVISQNPPAGVLIVKGKTVTIVVSKG
ncbi:MAG: Stk1 family PASTA domain-containing Ser/Thr kinase [Coriobacteriales bacterium]|nr:Stk1 family PASTA domain-containing Ser/Thr kinase [Coriobacteriales bacterium]